MMFFVAITPEDCRYCIFLHDENNGSFELSNSQKQQTILHLWKQQKSQNPDFGLEES